MQIDSAHEQASHQHHRLTEHLLGDDRFGGAWIDRTDPSRPVIGVAVVAPSQDEIDRIAAAARDADWPVHIVAVRYPRTDLIDMLQALEAKPIPGDAFVSLGWDPGLNNVVADLRR